ncbi:MAG: AAA family ATPase [candidate division WOR-3 bacterium]
MKIYEYFGLKQDPFSMIPDPKLFYESKPHSEALLRVIFSIENNRGAIAITGDAGTGKSILLRKILLNLYENQNYEPLLIICAHSGFDRKWFLKKLLNFYGIEEKENDVFSVLVRKIMERYEERNEKMVLLIDEADKIKNKEVMEDLRNLLNLEIGIEKIFHLVLVGSKDLAENLKTYVPFYQRIAIWAELSEIPKDEIENYINFRIEKCGGTREIFTKKAIEKIILYSHGIPRVINIICDSALLEAYLAKRDKVNEEIIERVANMRGIK